MSEKAADDKIADDKTGIDREQVVALIHRWFEDYWNARRDDVLDDLICEDCRQVDITEPEENDRGTWMGRLAAVRSAMPDIRFTVRDVLVEGNRAAASWQAVGTHTGEGLGVPPTGRSFSVAGMGIVTVVGGRLAHIQEIWDRPGLMRQLGLG